MDIRINSGTYYNPYEKLSCSNNGILDEVKQTYDTQNKEVEEDTCKTVTKSSGENEAEKLKAMNTFLNERINTDKKAPYSHLADESGIINYNGVCFVCNNEKQALCLGDVSNPKDVLTIPLSGGGCLMVNRNNIGALSKAIGMFSPEDMGRIMRAIAQDNQCRRKQTEIETFEDSEDGVEEAWRQAAEETGCDGFGYDEQGKKTHITQLDISRVLMDKDESVLGKTVESALNFAENALYRLNNPMPDESDSDAVRAAKAGEKRFYEVFIEKLKALQ
ncbi:MAG: hypothetical protein K2I03_13490 [Lachnospiraceae bacterium]|nr:hypothetical protein [Lachnospiraceae bacterium]